MKHMKPTETYETGSRDCFSVIWNNMKQHAWLSSTDLRRRRVRKLVFVCTWYLRLMSSCCYNAQSCRMHFFWKNSVVNYCSSIQESSRSFILELYLSSRIFYALLTLIMMWGETLVLPTIPHLATFLSDQIILNHQACRTLLLRLECFLHFKPFKITPN
jgi:hypothetical protein